MITNITHSIIYVLNLTSAIDFYTNKLGLQIHTDIIVNGERWVTVSSFDRPDFQILFVVVDEGMIFKSNQVKQMQKLVNEQTFSYCVFECENLIDTYEKFKKNGVKFSIEPYTNAELDEFEAVFFDDSGNWFRLVQKKK